MKHPSFAEVYPLIRDEFAEAFAYVLENGRLDLNPNTPFPDKICHGVSYTDPLLPHVPIAAGPGVLEHFAVRNYNEVMDAVELYGNRLW